MTSGAGKALNVNGSMNTGGSVPRGSRLTYPAPSATSHAPSAFPRGAKAASAGRAAALQIGNRILNSIDQENIRPQHMHVQMKQHIPIQKQQQHTLAQQKASYTAADKELRTHFPAAAEVRLEYSRHLTHHPHALHTNQPPLPQVKQPPQMQGALVLLIRAITEITHRYEYSSRLRRKRSSRLKCKQHSPRYTVHLLY